MMNYFLFIISLCAITFHKGDADCYEVCPDGWTRFEGSCYWIGYEQQLSFVEAEHLCRQHNSHLIHVNNDLENKFIKDQLHKTNAGKSWLGLSDMDIEGIWRWYDTNETAGYTDWYPGQPNKGDAEDCAVFAEYHPDHGYQWEDYPCGRLYHPVCERNMCDEGIDIVG